MTSDSMPFHRADRRGAVQPSRELLGVLVQSIAPYIEDDAVAWKHVEAALAHKDADGQARRALLTALREAGIVVDGAPKPHAMEVPEWCDEAAEPEPAETSRTPQESRARAVEAARRLMESDAYRRKLSTRLLTAQEEVGLGLLIQDGSTERLPSGSMSSFSGERRRAADTLFLHNTRLAWSVASHYQGRGLELDDLAQSAMIGLVRAVETFDPESGNKFSTYAMWWLRQAVTRAIANEGRMIRIPVHMHERIQKVWNKRDAMSTRGVAPRLTDLAAACAMSAEEVTECLRLRSNILSLDTPVGDKGASLADILDLPDREPTAFEILMEALVREQVFDVLHTLTERESDIIAKRHGLDVAEPMTLDAIGEVWGVTRERIRQIEKRAMEKLRDPSRSGVLEEYLY